VISRKRKNDKVNYGSGLYQKAFTIPRPFYLDSHRDHIFYLQKITDKPALDYRTLHNRPHELGDFGFFRVLAFFPFRAYKLSSKQARRFDLVRNISFDVVCGKWAFSYIPKDEIGLYVRPALCLQLPSEFRLTTDTLAVRLMFPLTGHIEYYFRLRRKTPLRFFLYNIYQFCVDNSVGSK
jgi:hypothetical protein